MSGHPSPWHPGEIQMQRTIGAEAELEAIGRRVMRDHLLDQHRDFYPLLPFVLLGAVDSDGWPWATVRAGVPGFLDAPDRWHLTVQARQDSGDPASAGLRKGDAVGLLGLQPHTRRRNRLNGTLAAVSADHLHIALSESFGNCPKYIHGRTAVFTRDPAVPPSAPPEILPGLDPAARALIRAAETFFVASFYDGPDGRRVDVSHRGGSPGFVRVEADGTLTVPDFAGNRFFNTLGNIVETGRAGLLFLDWDSGDTLQISGEAAVLLTLPEDPGVAGAERYWQVRPRQVVRRRGMMPLRWQETEEARSPFLAGTGVWPDSSGWRRLRVQATRQESAVVRSLILTAADGPPLPPARPGQHLPLRIPLPDGSVLTRVYTLSRLADADSYRISVKREGQASAALHGLEPGAVVEAAAPAGQFVLDPAETGPVLLLAAGIGITPIRAMLEAVVTAPQPRPVWLFYAARSVADRALMAELTDLARRSAAPVRLIRLLSDPLGAVAGQDYDGIGLLDAAVLAGAGLPDLTQGDVTAYLCGPPPFMQGAYDLLRAAGLADAAIRAEAFGPSALIRSGQEDARVMSSPAGGPVEVRFSRSGTVVTWTPEAGTLLEVAERAGLSPPAGCRGGSCGSCATRLEAGAVSPVRAMTATAMEGEILLCSTVPAAGCTGLTVAL
ncbi:2Fe-2S iron-sulfur cluster-binding protein [Novispirillum itersonii]|uniref:FAD-binding oxidoreductase n=1 Tax=Novispirillum itersonii TaxID=189 RepID=A0A7W9ZCC0_NOVIT|nr:pyridoxamine 5'-phosphate oxidase family protein [Novispirillum itersonii]MBB6208856.1 hypothetical protein [Novispirillum itersonii]